MSRFRTHLFADLSIMPGHLVDTSLVREALSPATSLPVPLDEKQCEALLDRYYELRGRDVNTGSRGQVVS